MGLKFFLSLKLFFGLKKYGLNLNGFFFAKWVKIHAHVVNLRIFLGCDAKLYTEDSGVIEVKNYEPEFNCRWEIKGLPGTNIKVIFFKTRNR